MGKQKILARLRDALGAGAAYELDRYAPAPEERQRLQAIMDEAVVDAAEAVIEMEAGSPQGRVDFTRCDPRVRARYLARKALAESLSARTQRRRIRAGRRDKSGVSVVAQGDNWDEIFAKLAQRV
ncbi:MAG TPA: hypothetical protein VF292_00410 [Rhodanobacteraceae bacterium]